MRYLDLAGWSTTLLLTPACAHILCKPGCELLTDMSVFEIAQNMTKLRRIGLVKVRLFHLLMNATC